MQGIAGPYETLRLGDRAVQMVNREALRELYQRGFEATQDIAAQRVKHEETAVKLRALDAAGDEPSHLSVIIAHRKDHEVSRRTVATP